MSLVKDLLKRKGAFVATVTPLTWVVDAAREMSERKIGSLVIVERGRVVGVLTERDLLTRVIAEQRNPETTTVAEVMSRDVVVCRPDSTLDDCKTIISSCRLRHLPVVDADGRVAGVVTSGDILHRELADQGEAIETLQAYIYGPMAVPWMNSQGSH